jgi:UTP--glucose-1-phosphate uridylyltransferase
MIKQAIIPAAGLGTRLLPLTSVIQKELLPINGKPGIEYILDECIEAGIKEVIIVISNRENSIKRYFSNKKFKTLIKKKNNDKKLKYKFDKIEKYKKIIRFVYQKKPKGTGDAILKCKKYLKSKYFLMVLSDDLIMKNNCTKKMIKLHKIYNSSVIASKKVSRKDVSRWGIFKLRKFNKNNFLIKDVIEKPSIKSAPSNYAVIGRYILPNKIFKILEKASV